MRAGREEAASLADEARLAQGRGPLPGGVIPHALRCTYISLLLEAGYSLPYVMDQVGHEDESTTLRIYARVLKCRQRLTSDPPPTVEIWGLAEGAGLRG